MDVLLQRMWLLDSSPCCWGRFCAFWALFLLARDSTASIIEREDEFLNRRLFVLNALPFLYFLLPILRTTVVQHVE